MQMMWQHSQSLNHNKSMKNDRKCVQYAVARGRELDKCCIKIITYVLHCIIGFKGEVYFCSLCPSIHP